MVKTEIMPASLDHFIAAVEAHYEPLITSVSSRLHGGATLWAQFEAARDAYDHAKPATFAALAERVNEMAVAELILADPALEGELHYEPDILPDGRRIDFVIIGTTENTYIEVKTVNPRTADSDANWRKQLDRRKHHPDNVHVVVIKEGLGASIYGSSFSARSRFLDYSREFEVRLAAAKTVRSGNGLLIFCGTGFAWDQSELEDFADFYFTGVHRPDDPFGPMERHEIERAKIDLLRNITAFGFVKRGTDKIEAEKSVLPVR
jgi:hypothetical protein